MLDIMDRLINWGLVILLVAAVYLLVGRDSFLLLRNLFTSRQRTRFLKRERKANAVEKMLKVVSDNADINRFAIMSGMLAIITFVLLLAVYGRTDLPSILLSIGIGSLPLIIRRAQLQSKRVKGSYEGMDLVATLANCYIISGKNISLALDMTVGSLKTAPYSKRIIASLTKSLKQAKNEDDINEALEVMTYAYHTEWANILSFCIFNAIVDSDDISAALSSLLEQFARAKVVQEKSKRYNRESFLLMQVLVPLVYIGSMYYGGYMFGNSFLSVLKLQVTTEKGIEMLLVMLGLAAACFFIASTLRKPKYDL